MLILREDRNSHYMNQYSCMNDGIRASSNWAGIRASTEHDFAILKSSLDST